MNRECQICIQSGRCQSYSYSNEINLANNGKNLVNLEDVENIEMYEKRM